MKFKALITVILGSSLLLSYVSNAQDFELPKNIDVNSNEGLQKHEADIINAAGWLESTSIRNEDQKRTQVNAFVLTWLTNTHKVTFTGRSSVLKLFDKNANLIGVFMASYARYCLQNNYSKDELKANVAAMQSVIKCYNLGGDIKKDKDLLKVIEVDKKGELEDYIKKRMS